MRKLETMAGGPLWVAGRAPADSAALEPVSVSSRHGRRASPSAACADGSASLVMGCASIQL